MGHRKGFINFDDPGINELDTSWTVAMWLQYDSVAGGTTFMRPFVSAPVSERLLLLIFIC